MEKKHEKEEELSLKQSRLKMLLLAEDSLSDGGLGEAKEWLQNYIDTVAEDTEPGIKLNALFKEFLDEYNVRAEETFKVANDFYYGDTDAVIEITNGMPVLEWQDQENAKAFHNFIRRLNRKCWSIGHQWDLIPKE